MADINFKHLKVLVIEDNEFVRLMLKRHLNEFGVGEIFEASDGIVGLELLSRKPDIILCDINMQPMNGFEFLKSVRSPKMAANKVPVVFITGDADSAQSVAEAKELTANACLFKPITAKDLKEKLISLLPQVRPY